MFYLPPYKFLINSKNLWDILKLNVPDSQKHFVSGNDMSIIEAYIAITSNKQPPACFLLRTAAVGNFPDGLGYLTNPLIPHAEKESPCGEVSKNDVIELADGQSVLIKGYRQEII